LFFCFVWIVNLYERTIVSTIYISVLISLYHKDRGLREEFQTGRRFWGKKIRVRSVDNYFRILDILSLRELMVLKRKVKEVDDIKQLYGSDLVWWENE